ncbi:MAG: hypothetical protein AUJ92_11850 [Armatimonadetes bacterium CG2_30_59_28]|nr:hypothetical protein [Armatimonadota bacterium]OIO93726.1 MAG: hypothetical protein AUJ92_11850 [Armatimonadetes bacterium CG2_30_59_28]PIY44255.1 MAG: hypothetical protein COZ05_08805 [Armatimonadetes bacterium CG_4_10_14_3_um_filter_59_10]
MTHRQPLDVDLGKFWKENERCFGRFDRNKPRTPVSLSLGEDFIKWRMGVTDHPRYYLDFDYQQQTRLACGKLTQEHIGLAMGPGINLGTTIESIFGGEVFFPPNAPPWIKPAVETIEDAKRLLPELSKIHPLTAGIMPRWLEYRERLQREYDVPCRMGGGAHGGAELAVLVCGATNFCYWAKDDPTFVKEFVTELARTMIRWNHAVRKETGNETSGRFSIANDSATLLSPDDYFQFSFPVEKMYYDEFAPAAKDTRCYHADSHMTPHLPALRELGVTDVNLGPRDDIEVIRRAMPDTVIHGQVPPMLTINGTPGEVYERCCSDIRRVGADGGLVLTTAGGICAGSWDHLRAFMAAAVDCLPYRSRRGIP